MPLFDPRRLRDLREERHLTADEVSSRTGKPPSAIRMYERGTMTPSPVVLAAIAAAYGVKVTDLYDRDDPLDPVTALATQIQRLTEALPPLAGDRRHRVRALLRGPARCS